MIETENKGGGVLLYVKSKLKPQETTFTSPFKDQVWCKIADLHIGVCYRSLITLLLVLTIMIICISYYMKSVKNISS